jgi:amidase
MFPEALERAKYLDEYLKSQGKPVGPLHGLPISIKDCFQVKGKQSTVGYVEFIKLPAASENSPLVEILLELGAVLYVKTNIPQTMMVSGVSTVIYAKLD